MPVSLFSGGIGFSYLENEFGEMEPYALLAINPEFSFGKIGVGIAANLRFSTRGAGIRQDDWANTNDFLAAIRYIRYGSKFSDGLYARFGALDRAQLGYGQQLYLYNNEISLDARKRGIEADFDFGAFGFESVWSNVTNAEIFGARAYARPLYNSPVPFVNRITVGASMSGDLAARAGLVNRDNPGEPFALEGGLHADAAHDDGNLVILGADIGLPISATSLIDITPYVDFAKILNYGTGVATGVQASATVPMAAHVNVRFENRFMSDRYLPSYFNSFYEIDRFQRVGTVGDLGSGDEVVPGLPVYNTRRNKLLASQAQSGWYGSVAASILGVADVRGSYERLRRQSNSGWLHLAADLGFTSDSPIVARATYDRWNIGDETDLFKLRDENALLSAQLGYRPYRFLLISFIYQESFRPIREGGSVVGYESQRRVEPSVQFLVSF